MTQNLPNYLLISMLDYLIGVTPNLDYLFNFLHKFEVICKEWNQKVLPRLHYGTYILPVKYSTIPSIEHKLKHLIEWGIKFSLPINYNYLLAYEPDFLELIKNNVSKISTPEIPNKKTLDFFPNLSECRMCITKSDERLPDMVYYSSPIDQGGRNIQFVVSKISSSSEIDHSALFKGVRLEVLLFSKPIPLYIANYFRNNPREGIMIKELTLRSLSIPRDLVYILIQNLKITTLLEFDNAMISDANGNLAYKFDDDLDAITQMPLMRGSLEEFYFVMPNCSLLPETTSKVLPRIKHLKIISLVFGSNRYKDNGENIQSKGNSFDYRFVRHLDTVYSDHLNGSMSQILKDNKKYNIYISSSILPDPEGSNPLQSLIFNDLKQASIFIGYSNEPFRQAKLDFTNQLIRKNLPNLRQMKFLAPHQTKEYEDFSMTESFNILDYMESLMSNRYLQSIEFESITIGDLVKFLNANHPTINSIKIYSLEDSGTEHNPTLNDLVEILRNNTTLTKLKLGYFNLSSRPDLTNLKMYTNILEVNRSLITFKIPFFTPLWKNIEEVDQLDAVLQQNNTILIHSQLHVKSTFSKHLVKCQSF
ncbi:hypothetical protein DLAC_06979 [Tieghemostelium lacteum]|uniref:Uncharacterized protein n=1 Tax=Tieghemostelium lacteum TaxID=361077 RepID=A0A151ZDV3_TIELA|nr:hypothetical protein DLAC_06979 [Tieghemostelium lacteum]|eukprot:KYQ92138.1 hypothetical protein DLAC_06979 [Tieghemostelium lacteum]